MFVAIMETETAIWHGTGATEKEAKDCIKKAWKADSHTDQTTDLEEWYGFKCFETETGHCERF